MSCRQLVGKITPGRLFRFLWRVMQNFRANQGLLLSGAVAFYTLLSIIPFITILLVALSHVVEKEELLRILESHLKLLVPGLAETLLADATTFLEYRHTVSWVGLLLMLFFSSTAFTVLESTISLIFHHRLQTRRRHAIVSAIIPYLYIMLMTIAFFLLTVFSSALHLDDSRAVILFSWQLHPGSFGQIGLYLVGIAGMVLLLTSFYLVMPHRKIPVRHAFMGGIAATALWEIVRHVMVWYFATLSMVNVIYGSLATVVVALLSLEAAGIILLLGAQLVAELDRVTKGSSFEDPAEGLKAGRIKASPNKSRAE